jgi:hypothetical protein
LTDCIESCLLTEGQKYKEQSFLVIKVFGYAKSIAGIKVNAIQSLGK